MKLNCSFGSGLDFALMPFCLPLVPLASDAYTHRSMSGVVGCPGAEVVIVTLPGVVTCSSVKSHVWAGIPQG